MIPSTLFALTLPALALAASRPKNAILLSDVESLTLRGHGAMTKHRRVSAIPQLRCLSNSKICDLYDIDVMRCDNQGSSYGPEDIQWSCTASLPETLKLGSTDVICEGYSSPDDDYVLKGSCGVEYRLALTTKGEHRYPELAGEESKLDWSGILFMVIFVAVLGFIIYGACIRGQENRDAQRAGIRRGGGGWGPGPGPGWGPGNDPPPPYPGTKPSGQDSWRPGFWSGAAGGAAAGYWAGSRNHGDNHHDNHHNYGSVGQGHGWGGGSSRSSSSGSNTRHESTGFGSTSRR
ncbi:hypothetical protein B0T10DRAFT_57978 [Thelonectria olida]|uniref:Store-operated calcium entry-associated regulatory factor n=1 Tax=Thelonectria olida TaxID=1576542 RepID=A0A9P9APU7_9HYPO|nr:hypothetical protein B0T10DRAFT_57978 [Thelonectria olida]